MGTALPFSDIDVFLQQVDGSKGCLIDTNLLIALNDSEHAFHDDAAFLIERLAQHDVPIYATVTARSEFIDYQRRVIVTEYLMDVYAQASKWKISNSTRDVLKSQRGWLDNELGRDREAVLTDSRIKECKQAFKPKEHSGQIGWVKFCQEFLLGKLLAHWNQISEVLRLRYIDMRSDDTKALFRKDLRWEDMYRLMEESAMGSGDAMIVNVLDCSVLPFAVTADYDLAYGTLLSTDDKTILVPDSLYRRHIKKLRF